MRFGVCYHRTFPASQIGAYARHVEDGGLADLWVIEDCFFTSAPSLAGAALAMTSSINVGIGILPAVVRHPAVTAMELATLHGLAPGRFVAGIGHGVQEWMAQMGLRPDSPLTALRETITVVCRLLSGETVTFHGETVMLDDVRLEAPPAGKVPVLAGVRGPRSMVLAGEVADGIILAEPASPSYVRWAREKADAGEDFEIAVFAPWLVIDDGDEARSKMAAYVDRELEHPSIGWRVLPFFEDLMDRRLDGGAAAIASMPLDWWHELAPIGTPADAHEHLDRLVAAGVHRIGAYPAPEFDVAMRDIEAMIEVARAR